MVANPYMQMFSWMEGWKYWADYFAALNRYASDFAQQTALASKIFFEVESKRIFQRPPMESLLLYLQLTSLNIQMMQKSLNGSFDAAVGFHTQQLIELQKALFDGNGSLDCFLRKQTKVMKMLAGFGEQIKAIKPQYGFHFDDGNYQLVDETERFWLYQVFPFMDGKSCPDMVKGKTKPVLIIPPYVLGANILCFLRDLGKSYVHSFANRGIPTYIRIIKPIDHTPAVSKMTQEEDCLDTVQFCKIIKKRHGNKKVTLNGYCQGGYGAVINWLSGKLDGLVDCVMTCVAPMDGTHSVALKGFLDSLPREFNNLIYGIVGSNGASAASGQLMSWIYKLRSIDLQSPMVAMCGDFKMMESVAENGGKLSPTPAALNNWLFYDRVDIPLDITRISFVSYNEPISPDGTLPVRVFNSTLNFNRFREKGVQLAIFYAPKDDLVEPEVALAAEKWATYVEPLVGGHVKKATSPKQAEGGPEIFHLGLAA